MPGRPLRRARRRALDALTPEQAHAVAAIAVQYLERENACGVLILALGRDAGRDVLSQVSCLSAGEARKHVAELVAHNDEWARRVIGMTAQHPEVEQALGITRRPTQHRP